MPPAHLLVVGDMEQTLPAFEKLHGTAAVWIHVDVTTGVPEQDAIAFAWLLTHTVALAITRAIILSGWALDHDKLEAVASQQEVPEGRYYAYKRVA